MRSPRDLYAHSRLRSPELKNLASCGWGLAAAGVGDILRLLGPAGSGGFGPSNLCCPAWICPALGPEARPLGRAVGGAALGGLTPRALAGQAGAWARTEQPAALGPRSAVHTRQPLHQGREEVCGVGSWHPPLQKTRRARS